MSSNHRIENVSDTSLWVAAYRALESERPDALFNDPFAGLLTGEKGLQLARSAQTSRFTAWAVATRTCIIDDYIRMAVEEGVTTVLNLGAGLDTRPYRLQLPAGLHWVEVDFPNIVALKNERLADKTPRCQLERIELDLSDHDKRLELFSDIASHSPKTLVITEGLLSYLTVPQAGSLADDLRCQEGFVFWIADFMVPPMIGLMKFGVRFRRDIKNAPVQFFPEDWLAFFREHGWTPREQRYYADEAQKLGRAAPQLLWLRLLLFLIVGRKYGSLGRFGSRFGGYALYEADRGRKAGGE